MPDIFSPEALQTYVETAMAQIPAGHRHALTGYYDLRGVWRVTVALRSLDGHWQLDATAGRDLGQVVAGAFRVMVSW